MDEHELCAWEVGSRVFSVVDVCLRDALGVPQLRLMDAVSSRMGSAAVFMEFILHDELHEP